MNKEIEALKAKEQELLDEIKRLDIEILEHENTLDRMVSRRRENHRVLHEVRYRLVHHEAA